MKKPFPTPFRTLLLVPILSLPLVSPSLAQGNGGGRPPRDDSGMRPNGMQPGGMRRGRGKGQLNRMWRGIGRLSGSQNPISKVQAQKIVSLVMPWTKRPQMSETEAQKLHQRLEAILTTAQKNQLHDGPFGGPGPDGPPPPGSGRNGGPGGMDGRPFDGPPRGERPPAEGPPPGEGFDGPPGNGGRGGNRPGQSGPGGGRRGRDMGGDMRGADMSRLSDSQMQTMRSWMDTSNLFYAPTGTAMWKKLPTMAQTRFARHYKENRATLEALSRKAKS